ncbi:helix-turn-helix transcriptional regulator [Streptosporangiaceae bacterium NEAU-GS5]|nr:helix-turn-helix transcriptional regulator [Streptosporangiaceae bacterium NEAU-GS5]
MRALPHPATEDIQLTEVLRALSDPARLAIVARLAEVGEEACNDLGDGLGVHKSTLSHHYRVLREAGVTRARWVGRTKVSSLRRDDLESRFPGLLDAIIDGALSRTHA